MARKEHMVNSGVKNISEAQEIQQILPLSPAQAGVWFASQLNPDGPGYNQHIVLRLKGVLRAEMLSSSIERIIERQAILRSTYVVADDEPAMRVGNNTKPSIRYASVSHIEDPAARAAEISRLLNGETKRAFDLQNGPVIRFVLLQIGREESLLEIVAHHIVCDWWSFKIFLSELSAMYTSYCLTGEPADLPELSIQYPEWIMKEREASSEMASQWEVERWVEKLKGVRPVSFGRDKVSEQPESLKAGWEEILLPVRTSTLAASFARRLKTTISNIMLAAFYVLLHKYSAQQDLAIGVAVGNRDDVECEDLIGLFLNIVVVRILIDSDMSVGEFIRAVSREAFDAYGHLSIPFERVVRSLPGSFQSRGQFHKLQVCNVSWAFHGGLDAYEETFDLPGLSIEVVHDLTEVSTIVDLECQVWQRSNQVRLRMAYSAEVFERSTVKRLLSHFQWVLEQLVEEPERKLSEVSLVSGWERKQLLSDWNRTEAEYREGCVHELFEAQAEQRPEAVAVVYEGERLSYGELNARANQLGRYLRELGVGPEGRVGLCVERGLVMVVGMLGVLKAGGAYVPLDPGYPVERLAFMLEDIQAPVVLTQRHLRQQMPKSESRVVCLDTEWEEIGRRDRGNLELVVSGKNLAYVIYTSGSTGRPKGVCVQHGGLANLALAQAEQFQIDLGKSVLQYSSPSFDASVSEWSTALVSGARIVVPAHKSRLVGQALANYLVDQQITTVTLPPSVLMQLTEATLPLLHTLVVAGEACPKDLVRRWSVGRNFFNAYGPTEVTVCASIFGPLEGTEEPLIGRPLGNVRVYVLDECGQLCPVGVSGELYVGGAGVSRGYLNRPGLTAERFVPDGYKGGGGRLYRTGDRVRWNERGELEYQGRLDEQVKVRGYRIEPGEIETVLQEYPGVLQSAVIAREDTAGDKRLVGYVVWSEGEPAGGVKELRSHVQRRLPEYMVPSAFVSLESLPLTGNGKLDRKALPSPERVRTELASSYVAPADAVEEILAGVWEQVLGVERVGVEDNFFELGGHSLLATQVVSRIRDLFQVELPLRVLFENPTVRAVAAEVELARTNGGAVAPPLVRAARNGDRLPLSYAQQRLWFISQLEPDSAAYNCPAAIRLSGELDVSALQRSLEEITRRHEVLRTSFALEDGVPVQEIASGVEVGLRRVDLSGLDEEERRREAAREAEEEARRPFDLSRGPLLRVVLLRLGEREHVLLVTMHHVVSDGWSVGVLIREFGMLYAAYRRGEESPLGELPIQYGDFAQWQREWLQGEVLEEQLGYWRRELEGLQVLELPTDHVRPSTPSRRGDRLQFVLARELTERLREVEPARGRDVVHDAVGSI